MPQGSLNVKKVSETNFPQIKAYTTKCGVEKAQEKYGYSARTLSSIAKADNYTTWRGTRKAKQPKRIPKVETTPPVAPVKPQAIQPVAPSQSVTTPQIKKPGHARDFTMPKKTPPAEYVTREEFDRVTGNQAQLINRAIGQIGNLGKEVEYLTKEDTAYKQADIAIADKASKSRWTRVREWFSRGRS